MWGWYSKPPSAAVRGRGVCRNVDSNIIRDRIRADFCFRVWVVLRGTLVDGWVFLVCIFAS